ncbi:acetyl/propionyl/methylcrotonyl-CoA carboxylase subunit alpha [Cycloclasticus pugetii]|uniref:acetyl/propionyl/methylcrotonyl-CoA carboxylase subunit alpha n=1 Tax=Cycloclasticus pugetii TaxID=34068 RepID=UPI000918F168|nr:acetyl/propionyl/methylcrotonyl-CoA carboxylase subunit alpha [Cycloclasticus pugetii]SHJ46274.1 3-methylcrotonoyl-CoA carboxylase, alpha subunit [Cycloclasticus pugetii]
MFKKILIANRGEIACRVISTLKKMGITSVAVYSDADRHARHVTLADEAYYIGASRPDESYLKADNLLALAKKVNIDAIHPGYGFLSENNHFARACLEAKITFIGPSADCIEKMGAKDAAKALMEAANVPVVPGYHGENQAPEHLQKQAEKVGFPLLIKAVSGGGGKGMRVVNKAAEFAELLDSVKREALNAFADDRVLLERYISKPRHIEFQIFGDCHKNYVHLHERECSLQRRHQKIIEETPSPFLDEKTRQAMGIAAVNAARAIRYSGAGTIEFIVGEDRSFYFMEMNTRLQVEHPVTEMVSGQDLVEWQIRVAAGQALPLKQEQIPRTGHSFEARLYAENPNNQFLPSTGKLQCLRFPTSDKNLRIETGVEQGDSISVFYDPMIAKLVVWGEDRETARERLLNALGETGIIGVENNIAFLETLATHPDFIENKIDTQYIDKKLDRLLADSEVELPDNVLLAATVKRLLEGKQLVKEMAAISADGNSPWFDTTGWRPNGQSQRSLFFSYEETNEIEIKVTENDEHFIFHLDDDLDVIAESLANDAIRLQINGSWERFIVLRHETSLLISWKNRWYALTEINPFEPDLSIMSANSNIIAPMPGKLLKVLVSNSDSVAEGQPLAIIEAMKMEHTLSAPFDGEVDHVFYTEDDFVEADATLITFKQQA